MLLLVSLAYWLGISTWSPPKSSCLAKGISAGLWVDFGEAWALAAGLQPAPTCKRSWTAASGHRWDFVLGCPLAAAAILSCKVQPKRWIAPPACSLYPSLACFLVPVVDKTRSSKSVEVQRVWEIYDERL